MLIVLSFVLLYCTGYLFSRGHPVTDNHAHSTIDGTRAYLGFAVFVSHFLLWRNYLTTGKWGSASDLVYHLGTTSVAFFFLISAFLFFGKISTGKIDWLYLYIGRFLRITPLWFFVFSTTLLILFADFGALGGGVVELAGQHQIKISYSIITAGVSWSLWYEWFLYFSLPLMAFLLAVNSEKNYVWIVVSALVLLALSSIYSYSLANFVYFAMGGTLALNEKHRWLSMPRFHHHIESILLLVALIGLYTLKKNDWYLSCLLVLLIFFLLVSGYDLWGLFSGGVSRFIAQQGYSLYLVQGPFIFFVLKSIGFYRVATLSDGEYIGLLCVSTPFFFSTCRLTYICIEKPFLNKKLTNVFHSRISIFLR